jgi:hypothetical protein
MERRLMFDPDGLPAVAARLWESAAVATGGRHSVDISVGPHHMTVTRLALIEVMVADDPPTRDEVEAWVIATAQRLGFDQTELTEDGTEMSPGRMSIRIPVDGFTVTVQGIWDAHRDPEEDLPANGDARVSKRPDLALV